MHGAMANCVRIHIACAFRVGSGMCPARVRPERPERLVRLDAACASRRRFFFLMDSGASHHMHNGNDFDFNTYKRLPNPIRIQLGNKTYVFATHHGSVRVQDHQIDALHTPSFRYSLLSVVELDSQRYHTKFGNGKCSIQNSNVTVMTGSQNGQLFQVEPIHSRHSDQSNSFTLLSTAKSHLWYKRLAHLNHISMKSLVDGYVPTDICKVWILAKHERKIIRVPVLQTTTPFKLVHSDTCGPFNTKSH